MIHGGGCLGNHGPPRTEPDPSAPSTIGWVEKELEPCRHVADTWVALICEKIVQVVLQEIVLEVVQEVVAYLEGFPGLGEAGATRARRGQ